MDNNTQPVYTLEAAKADFDRIDNVVTDQKIGFCKELIRRLFEIVDEKEAQCSKLTNDLVRNRNEKRTEQSYAIYKRVDNECRKLGMEISNLHQLWRSLLRDEEIGLVDKYNLTDRQFRVVYLEAQRLEEIISKQEKDYVSLEYLEELHARGMLGFGPDSDSWERLYKRLKEEKENGTH